MKNSLQLKAICYYFINYLDILLSNRSYFYNALEEVHPAGCQFFTTASGTKAFYFLESAATFYFKKAIGLYVIYQCVAGLAFVVAV